MSKTEPQQQTAGFTLIEVLIALVILAIAAGFAFSTVSGSFSRLSEASREQQAVMAAQTQLFRVGHDLPVQPGKMDGQDAQVRWVVEIGEAFTDPPAAQGLAAYPITVTVTWIEGGTERHLTLQSARLGPKANPL